MESEKGHNGLSGVLVIVRDGLIFLLFVLSVLLFSILSSGSKASALAETQPLQTPQPDSLAKEPGAASQSAMVLTTPETPENSINPEETATPQAMAAPVSASTQSPAAGAVALVVGIAAAWFGASLFQVAAGCCAVVFVLEFFI